MEERQALLDCPRIPGHLAGLSKAPKHHTPVLRAPQMWVFPRPWTGRDIAPPPYVSFREALTWPHHPPLGLLSTKRWRGRAG